MIVEHVYGDSRKKLLLLDSVIQHAILCEAVTCILRATVTFSSSALLCCTLWKVFRESFGVIHSLLSGRVGVQVSPHVLDLQLQVQLGALPGALSHTYTQVIKPWNLCFALL